MSDVSMVYNVLAKDKASHVFGKISNAAKIGLTIAAAAVVKFGVDSVQAFAEAEKSQDKLKDAFSRFPALADTNIDRLNALNSVLARKTKFDDDATASGQATLAQFKLTGTQIEQLTPLLQDYAAKTGKSLPDAANVLGKALMGQGRGLKMLGIDFKDAGSVNANYAQIMTGLREKVGGFAEKEGKSAAGQAEILKNQFGELEEKVGGMLVPALMKLVDPLRSVLDFMDRNGKTIMIVGGILGTLIGVVWAINAAVKAWTAVQIALDVVLTANPIGLIIMAIGVLIGVIVYLATKTKFFQTIWAHVWGFMKGVGAWFAGPFAGFFVRTWNNLVAGATRLWTRWKTGFNMIVSFVRGLPGRISSAARGMWDGLKNAFRGVINFIISGWNSLDFGIHVHLPAFLGGAGFDVNDVIPDIPYLAKGGIVTGPTLAMLGEGGKKEAVIPLERSGLGGMAGGRIIFDLRGGDAEMRRWLRRIIRSDGGTEVTFADGGLG